MIENAGLIARRFSFSNQLVKHDILTSKEYV